MLCSFLYTSVSIEPSSIYTNNILPSNTHSQWDGKIDGVIDIGRDEDIGYRAKTKNIESGKQTQQVLTKSVNHFYKSPSS